VQVRGSVPLFWGHPAHLRYKPPLQLRDGAASGDGQSETSRSEKSRSECALQLHLRALAEAYGHVTFVNLVDKKSDQLSLGTKLEAALSALAVATPAEQLALAAAPSSPAPRTAPGTGAEARLGTRTRSESGDESGDESEEESQGEYEANLAALEAVARALDEAIQRALTGSEKAVLAGEVAEEDEEEEDEEEEDEEEEEEQGELGALVPVANPFNVELVWFDFHAEVKGKAEGGTAEGKKKSEGEPKGTPMGSKALAKKGWDGALARLEAAAAPALDRHGFFLDPTSTPPHLASEGRSEGGLLATQSGVVRTNCVDCLDRTNVAQALFARRLLTAQLRALKVLPPCMDEPPQPMEPGPDLGARAERAFRLVWSDNADAISTLYAGTGALKGDFTRTGKRTLKGLAKDGLNSAKRYFGNHLLDPRRQAALDFLIAAERDPKKPSAEAVEVEEASARGVLVEIARNFALAVAATLAAGAVAALGA